MPALQKAFSEQNSNGNLRRQHWQRSKSNPTTKMEVARPPVPLSAVTKNKLQSFHFQPAQPAAQSDQKHRKFMLQSSRPLNARVDKANKENASGLDGAASFLGTKTPLNRGNWQDFMSISEGSREEEDTSPNERILWHTRNPSLPVVSPMALKQGRKRARSSSPASSPSARPTTPEVNSKNAAKSAKMPLADPAVGLWERFAKPRSNKASLALDNPLLQHLTGPSSPRPLLDGRVGSAVKDGSLRKAIGLAGPTKRRRLERQDSGSKDGSQKASDADSKSHMVSMVSDLLQIVDYEISKARCAEAQKKAQRSPSSMEKPLPRKTAASSQGWSAGSGSRTVQLDVESRKGEKGKDVNGSLNASDYGDDDLDDDAMIELQALSSTQREVATSGLGADVTPKANEEDAPPSLSLVEDEFGDLDDDFFDDAEDLLAQVDAKPSTPCLSLAQERVMASPDSKGAGLCGKDDDDDETYGDDFGADMDLDAMELAATRSAVRASSSLSHQSQQRRAIQRFLVLSVVEGLHTDDRGRELPEKILVVETEKRHAVYTVHLRDAWYETQASPKSLVHVIGEFSDTGMCVVDSAQNYIVLHPDQLISSTVVADSFSCMRRAVLQDRVKSTSDSSKALVHGILLHEIFQSALLANLWDGQFLESVIDEVLKQHLEDLYVIKLSIAEAKKAILPKMDELRSWASLFVSAQPRPAALAHGQSGTQTNLCVNKLLGVEEHVWSPMYGIKGNIDATVQVTVRDGPERRTLTMPFEVKTGKRESINHQAQTILYCLLLSDRYDIKITSGLLYYMETSKTLRVTAVRDQLQHIMIQRNRLATYMRERSTQLPPMKRSEKVCRGCYARSACFTYHKLADDGTGETSGMDKKFEEAVQHLQPVHRDFFLRWEDVLTKEEKETQKLRRELWTMVSAERERIGRCFGNVIVEQDSAAEDEQQSRISRYTYTLVKEKPVAGFSFLDSQLTVGEPIVISDEQGHFALALGFVTAVRRRRISVAVDRRLHNARARQPGFDAERNQVFAGIMAVGPQDCRAGLKQSAGPPVRYRLDRDEFSNGMATVRNNLLQIMAADASGSARIRSLVVELMPPRFEPTSTNKYLASGKGLESLNEDQRQAIEKVMGAKDYALVLGMPGTGKTTTISHIIRALVGQGKSVLLTSYTHTAVDSILLKLKYDDMAILRLGSTAKVHPEVQQFATLASRPAATFDEIHKAWHETPVVATTCLGIHHPLFNERTFDYCIVDEASQITLPICLGPIRMANTFVLVGDHNQLPPLVQNEEARRGGLDVSLFRLLSDTHPDSVVNLEHQYRMCEDIMTLSNTLIYNGRLKCGTEGLRLHSLHIPHMDGLRLLHFDATSLISHSQQHLPPSRTANANRLSFCPGPRPTTCWLLDMLSPSARVRFLNTDAIPSSREEAKGNRIVNPCEAGLVSHLVEALLAVGVPPADIGIMTHYRSQLALLKNTLNQRGGTRTRLAHIEMHTADRFQGRDKEVVILSLVRSNAPACSIGELLKDWRRINVAFTRAKTKLIVIGSRETLRGCGEGEMLARFLGLIEEKPGWRYDLPADALDTHYIEEGVGTQTQGTVCGKSPEKRRSPEKTPRKMRMASGSQCEPHKMPGTRVSDGAVVSGGGKENVSLQQTKNVSLQQTKKARVGERVLLKGKPVLRDILNDMMGGGF